MWYSYLIRPLFDLYFLQSLKGPHHYQIGDHGGFLAAVSKSEPNPNIVKFSTDEGNCWHEYQFTNKTLNFTGK